MLLFLKYLVGHWLEKGWYVFKEKGFLFPKELFGVERF